MKVLPLCLAVALVTLASCATKLSAPIQIKQQSYDAALAEWQLGEKPLLFGRKRTIQIFNLDRLQLRGDSIVYSGNLGTAALVTPDGYALTADHVIPGDNNFGTLYDKNEVKTGSSFLHITKLVVVNWDPESGEEKGEQFELKALTSYPGGRLFGSESLQVGAQPLRIVKRFPASDLALVKLPFNGVPYFDLAPDLRQNRSYFSSGSAFAAQTAPSAGKLFKLPKKGPATQRLLTTIPVASGDSGGPIIDSAGKLAGIVSTGELAPTRSLRFLLHSRFAHIKTSKLTDLIESDRREQR